jgi:hypothetical protein
MKTASLNNADEYVRRNMLMALKASFEELSLNGEVYSVLPVLKGIDRIMKGGCTFKKRLPEVRLMDCRAV